MTVPVEKDKSFKEIALSRLKKEMSEPETNFMEWTDTIQAKEIKIMNKNYSDPTGGLIYSLGVSMVHITLFLVFLTT